MKQIKRLIDSNFKIVKAPEKSFSKIEKNQIDFILGDYLKLLLLSSFLAGFSLFLLTFLKSLYFDLFFGANINYLIMLNYSLGISLSMFFLYVFLGTAGLILLSFILKLIFLRIYYVKLLKLLLFSAAPMLLFGWVPKIGPSMLLWSLVLFFLEIKK